MNPSEVFEIVKQSFKNGRMPHAYIVCGSPRGNGLAIAETISAFMLCTDDAKRPCRVCDACLNALAHKPRRSRASSASTPCASRS